MKTGTIGMAVAATIAACGLAPAARAQFSCVFSANGVVRYSYQQSISMRCAFTLEEVAPVAVQDRVTSVVINQKHDLVADVDLASYSGNADACDGQSCDFSHRIPDYSHSADPATRSATVVRDPNYVQVFTEVDHTANADMGVSGNACLGSAAPSVWVGGTGGTYVLGTGYEVLSTSFRALSGSYQTQCFCFFSCDDPYSYYADTGRGSINSTDTYTMYVAGGRNALRVTVDMDGGLSSSTQKNEYQFCGTPITCIGTPAEPKDSCKQALTIAMYNLGTGASPTNPVKGSLIAVVSNVGGSIGTTGSTWGGTGVFSSVNSATPNSSSNSCGGLTNLYWDVNATSTPSHTTITLPSTGKYILEITVAAKGGA